MLLSCVPWSTDAVSCFWGYFILQALLPLYIDLWKSGLEQLYDLLITTVIQTYRHPMCLQLFKNIVDLYQQGFHWDLEAPMINKQTIQSEEKASFP